MVQKGKIPCRKWSDVAFPYGKLFIPWRKHQKKKRIRKAWSVQENITVRGENVKSVLNCGGEAFGPTRFNGSLREGLGGVVAFSLKKGKDGDPSLYRG